VRAVSCSQAAPPLVPVAAIDELAAELGEHRRLQQPPVVVGVQAGEQLVAQVLDDEVVVAPERSHEALRVAGALEGEPGEHEAGGLVGGEPEVVGADLRHPTSDAQATEPERRVDAGGEHHGDPGRAQVDEALHAPVDPLLVDEVVVVDDEQELRVEAGQSVDQRRDDGALVTARTGDHGAERGGGAGPGPLDRFGEVGPEPGRVGVGFLDLQPRHRF
jgi:hypothetical protein